MEEQVVGEEETHKEERESTLQLRLPNLATRLVTVEHTFFQER